MHIFFQIGVLRFLGYIPRSGIAGSKGSSIFNFWGISILLSTVAAPVCIPTNSAQNTNMKEHKDPYVHCSIIYRHKDMEAAQVSISGLVNKTTRGHLHNGILLGCKKEDNFTLFDSMGGPGEHYAKSHKPVKER